MAKITKGTMDVRLRGVHAPTADNDAANKEYVDGAVSAISSLTLLDGSVTTPKLADDAVTAEKLGPNSVDADALNVSGDGSSGQILTSDGDGSFSWGTNVAVRHTLESNGTAVADRTAINFSQDFTLVDDAVGDDTGVSIANNAITASKLNVAGNGSAGQVLSSDGDGSFTWVSDSGGSIPAEHVTLTLSPTDIEVGSANTNVSGTISLSGGYTFLGTGSADNGSGGNDTIVAKIVRGATEVTLPSAQLSHATLTANTFTLQLLSTDIASAGELQVTATVKARGADGAVTTRTATGTANIERGWFAIQSTGDFPSTDLSSAASPWTDRGIWTGTGSQTFTSTVSGGRKAWIALPTRSAGYTFKSGILFVTTSTPSASDWSVSGWTLYEIEDANDGFAGTLTVEITET